MSMFKFFRIFLALCFGSVSAGEPVVNLKTDRPDAIYHLGETVVFTAELLKDGATVPGVKLRWRIARNGDWERSRETVSGSPLVVKETLRKPGWLALEVSAVAPGGKAAARSLTGAMIAPDKIAESAPEPEDFDAFWKKQRSLLNRVPLEAIRREVDVPPECRGRVGCWDVQVKCAGAKPVSGYLAMPANARPGSLPAEVSFHGAGVHGAHKDLKGGSTHIVFDVNAHGILNGQPWSYYKALNEGELKGYRHAGKRDRDAFYFKEMYLRAMRALDYVKSLPEWDGRTLIVSGVSQGGGQAIAAAALDPQVTFCLAAVPAMGDHAGRLAGRMPGWPFLVNSRKPGAVDRQVFEAAKYFDNSCFAKRIRCEVFFAVGFIDFTCSPNSVFAAYNNLPPGTVKHIQTTPAGGHDAPFGEALARRDEIIRRALKKDF